ncbi:hypothetical protein [Streptomyces sp. NPDC001635]
MPDPSTARLGLYKSKSDGSELVNYPLDLGQNWDRVDLAAGFQPCTSSTRPSTPYSGKPIFETDTGRSFYSNGTAPASASWVEIPNSSGVFGGNLSLSASASLSIGAATLTRTSGGSLNSNSNFLATRTAASDIAYSAIVGVDTFDRLRLYADGKYEVGPGNAARDVNLYRSGANTLATDDSFTVGIDLTVTGRLTVNGVGQSLPKYKASTTNRTSTTSLAADPDITFPVVANATYLVDGLILFAADPAGDFKMGWTAPSGAAFQWSCFGQASTATAGSGSIITDGQDLTSTSFGLGGVTDNNKTMTAQVRGYLTVAGTAGNFVLQWAQVASSANATKLLAGTHVRLTRVA